MPERKHYETRHAGDYIAKLSECGDTCREIVFYKGAQIYFAEFPTRNLGTANRGGYLKIMAASIAALHKRTAAIAAKWIDRIGLGFHPDTRGGDYLPAMSVAEAAEYDRDMETLFRNPGLDPYAVCIAVEQEKGLIP